MLLKRITQFDPVLAFLVLLLVLIGILVLSSVSAVFSQEQTGTPTYYLFHQMTYGLIPGLLLGTAAFVISLSWWKKWAFTLLLANVVLMALVFVPKLGLASGGAARWINIGVASFQPSEFLKLTFILYLSAWLASRVKKTSVQKQERNRNVTLLPFLVIMAGIVFLLALQSDLSTLGVVVAVAALMYFSSPTPLFHSMVLFLLIVGTGIALIRIAPYRMKRILVFLNLNADPQGIGYQIKQALIAVGSGGIFGLGLGMSNQKFGFVPQTMSDSIFAIFAEETGFVGSIILIFLFLFFLWRGVSIARRNRDTFSQLCAIGISSWIVLQALVNIGAMIGLVPLTGIPLPFVSYGGSHLAAELMGVGILLNISKSRQK